MLVRPNSAPLSTVRELVASGPERLELLLTEMADSPLASVAEEARATLGSLKADETTSVIKNAVKALALWSKDRIGGQLTASHNVERFLLGGALHEC